MSRDDAHFLAAAERAAVAMCLRSAEPCGGTVTLSHDEYSEIALAFDRAVHIAIAAHLASTEARS